MGVHTFTQGYLSESERNNVTGVWTRLLRFLSRALSPLRKCLLLANTGVSVWTSLMGSSLFL